MAAEHFGRKLPVLLISMAAGILVCYAFGTIWFMTIYAKSSGAVGILTALGWCVFPYLLPDAAKIALAAFLTLRLYPILQRKRAS
jgi:biotin transport system substrate-specific component